MEDYTILLYKAHIIISTISSNIECQVFNIYINSYIYNMSICLQILQYNHMKNFCEMSVYQQ